MTTPTVTLISPFQDPPNTFRAMSVADMYSFTSYANLYFSYNVGIAPAIIPLSSIFTNKALNVDLQVDIVLPSYMTFNIPTGANNPGIAVDGYDPTTGNFVPITIITSGSLQNILVPSQSFIVHQNSSFGFSTTFYEQEARVKSLSRTRIYEEDIRVTVTPINVTGPVYISTVPPTPPTLPPPPTPPAPPTTPDPGNPGVPRGGGGGGGGGGGNINPPKPQFPK